MDKLISQLTPAGAALQDTDVIEGQLNGNAFSNKLTGLQVRSVEKAERESQDNIIEASCGLQTDGSYLPAANSWNIRAVDFAAGMTDRHGASGALTPSIQNALRLLDAKINSVGSGAVVFVQSNINADTTLNEIVPAGYLLEYIIFNEKAGNAAILDLGISAGGSQVFLNQPIAASGLTVIVVQNMYSLTVAQSLYINDDDASSEWNGAIVDAYFVLKPIIAGGVTMTPGIVIIAYYTGAYGATLPPTELEIEAIIGPATNYNAGSVFIIHDTTWGGGDTVFVMSNGTTWDINSATFIPAL